MNNQELIAFSQLGLGCAFALASFYIGQKIHPVLAIPPVIIGLVLTLKGQNSLFKMI